MQHENRKLKLGLTLPDLETLTQRDVEKYVAAVRKQVQGNTPQEYNGKSLRAAIEVGWIKESEPALTMEGVDTMKPNQVNWFAGKIDALYTEATTVPPD